MPLTTNKKKTSLLALKKACLECDLCDESHGWVEGFNRRVFSNGKLDLRFRPMIVGQNPGREEVEKGVGFVGDCGKELDALIEEFWPFTREECYISNVVKCYTDYNRAPNQEEISNCCFYIRQEIDILKPSVVLVLGNIASKGLLNISSVSGLRGKFVQLDDEKPLYWCTYHPSVKFRNRAYFDLLRQDMKKLGEFFKILEQERQGN